jgi:hypothetical protein
LAAPEFPLSCHKPPRYIPGRTEAGTSFLARNKEGTMRKFLWLAIILVVGSAVLFRTLRHDSPTPEELAFCNESGELCLPDEPQPVETDALPAQPVPVEVAQPLEVINLVVPPLPPLPDWTSLRMDENVVPASLPTPIEDAIEPAYRVMPLCDGEDCEVLERMPRAADDDTPCPPQKNQSKGKSAPAGGCCEPASAKQAMIDDPAETVQKRLDQLLQTLHPDEDAPKKSPNVDTLEFRQTDAKKGEFGPIPF